MSNDLFSIGTSAMTAAYTALRTAGNNVSNVNTPGYTRQTAVLAPQTGAFAGGFYIGQGVQVTGVKREYNDFLTQAAHLAQSLASQADTRTTRLTQVSSLFADTTNGIGNTIDAFFSSLQALSQNPGDASARAATLSSGKLLSQRMNDIGNQMQDMRNSTDAQLRHEIDGVNQLTSQVAQLNDRIALARGTGSSPNDLLDLRDTAIRNLNAAVRVTSVPQDDGATNLFLANGQPLVVGNRAGTMAMQVSKIDPQEISIGVRDAVGNLIELDPNTVGGGTVAGLALFRANDLPKVENSLGQIAVAVSDQFNMQHKLGDDSNGAAGVNFFTPPTINAFASSLNTSAPAATVAASFVDTTQTQASDYKLQFIGGATGYQLTRASDKAVTTYATLPQTVDGMSINVAGTPAIGDVFMIQPSRNGSRNIGMAVSLASQIAAAAPVVASQATANKGQVAVEDLSVVGPVRNANLKNTVTLNFTSASSFTYTTGAVTSAAQAFTSGQPININGWSLTLRGAPANGDVFTIGANVGGIGDNRNAIKLAQLPDLALVNGGRMAGAFGGLVATVGGLAGGATTTSDAQSALLKDALNAESSVAGVNLDEEASRLMQFQQQYQAAAKIIQTARTLFDQILQLGN